MDVNPTEIIAIEEGYKQAILNAWTRYYQDTDNQSKWSDGATARFRQNLIHARTARAAALRMIAEEVKE